jgi:HK97 family phage prohead protease
MPGVRSLGSRALLLKKMSVRRHGKEFETRLATGLEVRKSDTESKTGTLQGYAAVFNAESNDFGGWREIIEPGAFRKDLFAKTDVRALVDHDSGRVIGRTKNGTLRLKEDSRGLLMELDLPNTQDGRDLAESVNRGDIDQMSFGFLIREEDWSEGKGYQIRHVKDVELVEVSVVAFPAYPQTEVGKRSFESLKGTAPEKSDSTITIARRRFELISKSRP